MRHRSGNYVVCVVVPVAAGEFDVLVALHRGAVTEPVKLPSLEAARQWSAELAAAFIRDGWSPAPGSRRDLN
jgi:hypothetical protein